MPDETPKTGDPGTKGTRTRRRVSGSQKVSPNTGFPSPSSGRRVRHGVDPSLRSQISAAVPSNERPANPADSPFGHRRTIGEATERINEGATRRATIAALEIVAGTGRLDILRDLTKDSDVDIAENALRTLNAALRSTLPTISAETAWDIRLAKAGVHVLNALDDHTVVLAYRIRHCRQDSSCQASTCRLKG